MSQLQEPILFSKVSSIHECLSEAVTEPSQRGPNDFVPTTFRLNKVNKELVEKICESHGSTLSEFIRKVCEKLVKDYYTAEVE